jgi:hypothetical protein
MTAVEQAFAAYLQSLKDLHAAAERASEAQVNYDTAKALEKMTGNVGPHPTGFIDRRE